MTLTDDVRMVLAAIDADAAAGQIDLSRVQSFADLHDFVDANEYALVIDPSLAEVAADHDYSRVNAVFDAVSAVLTERHRG